MNTFQKLVLRSLAQILLILSNNRQASLKDMENCSILAKEIKEELSK